jgi:DNA-binding CsgD family transcriptional regulator
MARRNSRGVKYAAGNDTNRFGAESETEWATPFLDTIHGAVTREVLSRAMREICLSIGADQFCLADLSRSHAEEPPQILSSNWSFDAIDLIGTSTIELLHQSLHATPLGEEPRLFVPTMAASDRRVIDIRITARLIEFGHCNIFLMKLKAGARRGICILSSASPRQINTALLDHAHLACNYLMSRNAEICHSADKTVLSERERECLYWVSEGKTTQEIALILGVSSNTVNKYIVSSIQKLGAANRAMAIAVAIRAGII